MAILSGPGRGASGWQVQARVWVVVIYKNKARRGRELPLKGIYLRRDMLVALNVGNRAPHFRVKLLVNAIVGLTACTWVNMRFLVRFSSTQMYRTSAS